MTINRHILKIIVGVAFVLIIDSFSLFHSSSCLRIQRIRERSHLVTTIRATIGVIRPCRYFRYSRSNRSLQCSLNDDNKSTSSAMMTSSSPAVVTSPSEKSMMLFELPGETFSIRSTAAYIQKWAMDSTGDGNSFNLENLVDGIQISFSVDPTTSFLNLRAVQYDSSRGEESTTNVFIKASLANSSPNFQIRSLVSFAAENLLAGFINTINSLLLESISEDSSSKVGDNSAPQIHGKGSSDEVSKSVYSDEDLQGIKVTYTGDNVKIDIDTTRDSSDNDDDDDWSSNSQEFSAEQIKEMERTIAGLWREVPLDEPTSEPAAMAPSMSSATVPTPQVPPPPHVTERNILYAWDGVIKPSEFSTVVNVLQSSLQEKYSGKGAGIEIATTSSGVVVSFAIAHDKSPNNELSGHSSNCYTIEFLKDYELSKTVISSNRDLFLDQQQRLQSSGTLNDDEINAVLLQRAINNLESYLIAKAKGLQVSFVNPIHSESIQSSVTANSDLDLDRESGGVASVANSIGLGISDRLPDTNELFLDENDMNSIWKTASVISGAVEILDDDDIASSTGSDTSVNRNVSPNPQPQKILKKDPRLLEQAMEMGFKFEAYENKGLESQAVKELEDMVANARSRGFIDIIRKVNMEESVGDNDTSAAVSASSKAPRFNATELFKEGSRLSKMNLVKTLTNILSRPNPFMEEDLSQPPTKLPFINNGKNGLRIDPEALDIFEGPPIDIGGAVASGSRSSSKEDSNDRTRFLNTVDAAPPNKETLELDKQRLLLLITDLNRNPTDVHEMILGSFRDLMMSENLLYLLRQANATSASGFSMWEDSDKQFIKDQQVIRDLLSKVSSYAAKVNLELVSLIEEESKRHLETIYQICDVSYKFQADELRFLEEIEFLKPKFDTELLSYLKFAIETEIDNIRLKGSDPVTMPTPWLQILQVVYQGVLAEFETRFDRLLEPLLLAMRFDEPDVRKELFKRFVNITTALDLRYMKTMASNMAINVIRNYEKTNDGDQDLYKKMIQLLEDIEEFLSDDIIDGKVEEFTEMAKEQGVEIVWRHRNPEKQDILNEFEKNERAASVFSESDGRLPKGLSSSVLEINGNPRERIQGLRPPELPE